MVEATNICALTTREVLEEIAALAAKAQALSPEETDVHLSFLEFAQTLFQPDSAGIRLRHFHRDGSVDVVAVQETIRGRVFVGSYQVRPDQLRWLIRRIVMTGQSVGAAPANGQKAQKAVDWAGVSARISIIQPPFGSTIPGKLVY